MNPIFIAQPTYNIKTKGFEIRNYGQAYFFPNQSLQTDLKEVIIFTENNIKRDIPVGSVWTYNTKIYKPQILKDDVGCGITGFVTEKIDFIKAFSKELISVIRDLNIHIGRGNHFIDFTTGHPLHPEGNMIFIHSDFNKKQIIPKTISEAQQREQDAKSERIETIERILKKIGIKGELYQDWTHNSVEIEDEKSIYRKGSINLAKTNNEGLLALNPFDGVYLYTAMFDRYKNSMQHSTGNKNKDVNIKSNQEILKEKKIEIMIRNEEKTLERVYDKFNSEKVYFDKFILEQHTIGYCSPKLIIKTN